MDRRTLGRVVVTAGCVYEIVALWWEPLPTISELVYEASNHRFARPVAWAFGGYALDHFFGD